MPYPTSHLQQRRGTASSRHIQHLVRTWFSIHSVHYMCMYMWRKHDKELYTIIIEIQSTFFSLGLNQISDIHQTEKYSTQVSIPSVDPEFPLCNRSVRQLAFFSSRPSWALSQLHFANILDHKFVGFICGTKLLKLIGFISFGFECGVMCRESSLKHVTTHLVISVGTDWQLRCFISEPMHMTCAPVQHITTNCRRLFVIFWTGYIYTIVSSISVYLLFIHSPLFIAKLLLQILTVF